MSVFSLIILCRVGIGCDTTSFSSPVGVHKSAGIAYQFVRVSTEVVALSLNQVGRQNFGSIAVVEGQSSTESGGGNPE